MRKILFFLVGLLPYLIVFIGSLSVTVDTDLGWHLKFGEYLVKNGSFLYQNTFSSEMPGFYWFNSSWASDIMRYFVFHHYGFIGLTVLSSFIVTLTFYFFAKAFKLGFWEKSFLFPLLLIAEDPVISPSFRAQLISFLFLGILYFIITQFTDGKKQIIFWTVPLFFLWANLHAEFILGLALFALFILIRLLNSYFKVNFQKQKFLKDFKPLLFSFTLSALVVLINPYGTLVYTEPLVLFGNPLTRGITEYLPFPLFSPEWNTLVFWGILLLLGLFSKQINVLGRAERFFGQMTLRPSGRSRDNRYDGDICSASGTFLIPVLLLYFLSFFVRRYAWPMYFLSVPFIAPLFSRFKPKNIHRAVILPFLLLIPVYIYVSFFRPVIPYLFNIKWDTYCFFIRCSVPSAEFLQNYHPAGPILNDYDWGGFLIWNYPDLKPAIDGRMPFWVDKSGYSPFLYYLKIQSNYIDVDSSKFDIVYMPPTRPIYQHMRELVKKNKWKLLYEDPLSGIFGRVKNK